MAHLAEALVVIATNKNGSRDRFIVPSFRDLEQLAAANERYTEFLVTTPRGKDVNYRVFHGRLVEKK